MTDKEIYKYDVAFSFLTEDEPLAQRLNDAIKDEVRTFIYTEHQDKLASKDAAEVFPEVFKSDTRVVVVLYRNGWGDTKMTGIEQEAIKSRRYEQETYQFLFVIKTDPKASMPDWIPGNYIWNDLERFGEDVIPPLILQKVRENDGNPRQLTVIERAKRHAKEEAAKKDRDIFMFSGAAVAAVKEELEELYQGIDSLAKEITNTTSLILTPHRENNWLYTLFSFDESNQIKQSLSIYSEGLTINDTTKFELLIETWEEYPARLGRHYFVAPKKTESAKFKFDRKLNGQIVWQSLFRDKHYTTDQLTEYCLELLMEQEKKS